jgi:hypothetical protein
MTAMTRTSPAPLAPADTPLALQPLQELPLPAPVSYVPQTPGWVIVALVLVMAAALIAWTMRRRYRRARYRRAALAELARIEADLHDATRRSDALAAIPALLKRTALAATSRERVAALSGADWLAFLQRTRGRFDERSGRLLATASYAPPGHLAAVSQLDADTLVSHARDWIQHHHVEI